MIDWILIGILMVLLGVAVGYIYKAKKNGHKCIGCPHAGSCNGSAHCSSSR